MPKNLHSSSQELEFVSFRDWNGDYPSQTLIFHDNSASWWIRVEISWSLPDSIRKLGYFKRQSLFQEFIKAIDFRELELVDDTVTLVSLTMAEQSRKPIAIRNVQKDSLTETNYFLSVIHQVSSFQIEEDPKRVIYPPLDQTQNLPIFEAGHLEIDRVIHPTVSIVRFKEDRLAYKKVDRPIYEPEDTEHILSEIRALADFRGQPNIAQLMGLVISGNPYRTHPQTISSPVITGFLLEYYPEGDLEQVLAGNKDHDDLLLRRWALQIGRALQTLHLHQRTHLDIKPSNIVFDAKKNAILIDISGTAGYEWEWLSPEMQETIQRDATTTPASASFDKRVAADCWAYGKLLSLMAKKFGSSILGKRLQSIGEDLTKMDPKARISLENALERIDQ